VINILGISKQFGNIEALKNVSFDVKDGEIMGLLGENGAGKSTLLRILSTMIKPGGGTAEVNGYDISKKPEDVRKSVGILFGSDSGLYDRLTARENLEFFATLNGMEQSKITMNTSLKDDLLADSLDIVEIIMQIEEQFGIEVDDEDALQFNTIADVVNYIEKKSA